MLFLTNTESLKVLNSEKFIKMNTVSPKNTFSTLERFSLRKQKYGNEPKSNQY